MTKDRTGASMNTAEGPDAVSITQSSDSPSGRTFAVGLPAHSILRLRLPPRR